MRIGIVGTGDVGTTLASGFAKRGHDVVVGTRRPDGAVEGWSGRVATMAEAAKHGEIVVFAVKGDAVESAADLVGAANLAGKIVIDVTNALDFSQGMPPTLLWGVDDSCAERLQRRAPAAKVVKAFNTVSHPQMVEPHPDSRLMIAGDDADAKARVATLAKEFGWVGAIDVGPLREARWLEALVPLWVRVGVALGRWDHVFEVRHG